MVQKSEFRTVEFFRKVRDEQAAMLAGKNHEEIIAFFSSFTKHSKPNKTLQPTAPDGAAAELHR
jgi:hypothetical protein